VLYVPGRDGRREKMVNKYAASLHKAECEYEYTKKKDMKLVADEEPGSEASEREKREREEYFAQVAEEERALGEKGGFIDYLFIILFLFISYARRRKAEYGGEEATSRRGP